MAELACFGDGRKGEFCRGWERGGRKRTEEQGRGGLGAGMEGEVWYFFFFHFF